MLIFLSGDVSCVQPTSGWANNRDTGDLRRHRAHYNVSVIYMENVNVTTSVSFVTDISEIDRPYMATKIMVNNSSVNGLLPDGSYLNQYWLEMVMMIGIHPSTKNAHDMLAKKVITEN